MYKTIRHGENSLQYTILPQHDEASGSGAASGVAQKSSAWPPTFTPPLSADLEPGTVIRSGSRKRSCLAYVGLVIVVSIMVGAVLVPVVLTTVMSGAKELKWYWPRTASASATAPSVISAPNSGAVVAAVIPLASSPSANTPTTPTAEPPGSHILYEPQITAGMNQAANSLPVAPPTPATMAVDDAYADIAASSYTAQADFDLGADGGEDLLMDGLDDGTVTAVAAQSVRTSTATATTTTTTAATTTANIISTISSTLLAAIVTPTRKTPPQAGVPGRKLRKPKVSRQHVTAAAGSTMIPSAAVPPAMDLSVPVITAGGQRNWIRSQWPIMASSGIGGAAEADGTTVAFLKLETFQHIMFGLLGVSVVLIVLWLIVRASCSMCRRKRVDLLTVDAQNGDNATLIGGEEDDEEEVSEEE